MWESVKEFGLVCILCRLSLEGEYQRTKENRALWMSKSFKWLQFSRHFFLLNIVVALFPHISSSRPVGNKLPSLSHAKSLHPISWTCKEVRVRKMLISINYRGSIYSLQYLSSLYVHLWEVNGPSSVDMHFKSEDQLELWRSDRTSVWSKRQEVIGGRKCRKVKFRKDENSLGGPNLYIKRERKMQVATFNCVILGYTHEHITSLVCVSEVINHIERKGIGSWWGDVEHEIIPSTRDVKRVTLAAFRRPAGKLSPIFSSFSLKERPPFFDLALDDDGKEVKK